MEYSVSVCETFVDNSLVMGKQSLWNRCKCFCWISERLQSFHYVLVVESCSELFLGKIIFVSIGQVKLVRQRDYPCARLVIGNLDDTFACGYLTNFVGFYSNGQLKKKEIPHFERCIQ